jgi:hypothetical protein
MLINFPYALHSAKLPASTKESLVEPSCCVDESPPTMSDTLFNELERRRQWSTQNSGQGKTIQQIAADLGAALC